MAGAERLVGDLPKRLGRDVRVVRAPCMGACDRAPVVAVGHAQVMLATTDSVAAAATHGAHSASKTRVNALLSHVYPTPNDLDAYLRAGGYALLKACLSDARTR